MTATVKFWHFFYCLERMTVKVYIAHQFCFSKVFILEIGKLSTCTDQIIALCILIRFFRFSSIPYIIFPHCCERDIPSRHCIFWVFLIQCSIPGTPYDKVLSVYGKWILGKLDDSSFRHIFLCRSCSCECLTTGFKCHLKFRQNFEIYF